MNWRPDKNQWEKTRCDLCFENECEGDDCEACREVYEAGASAMLSARDKWWIERIQKEVFDGGCYILRADTKATCERCGEYSICHMVKWQQLKREVGQ